MAFPKSADKVIVNLLLPPTTLKSLDPAKVESETLAFSPSE